MALPLTPENLQAAYDYLCTTQPYNRWNLPDGEDVVFKVVRDRSLQGWHTFDGIQHVIGISGFCIGTSSSLIAVMAHEMVHVHENAIKISRVDVEHSQAFKRFAARVCQFHGFDPKLF